MNEENHSPLPQGVQEAEVVEETMDFYEALRRVVQGARIYRQEWKDKRFYGLLKDNVLMLHKPDGQFYQWVINEGDILGEDWVVI